MAQFVDLTKDISHYSLINFHFSNPVSAFCNERFSFQGTKVILKETRLPEVYGDSACRARAGDPFWNPYPAVSKIP
jgi:hypothetical protein